MKKTRMRKGTFLEGHRFYIDPLYDSFFSRTPLQQAKAEVLSIPTFATAEEALEHHFGKPKTFYILSEAKDGVYEVVETTGYMAKGARKAIIPHRAARMFKVGKTTQSMLSSPDAVAFRSVASARWFLARSNRFRANRLVSSISAAKDELKRMESLLAALKVS